MAESRIVTPADTAATPAGRGSFLLSFTGLIPVVLAVPILILHLYGLGIAVSVVSSAAVIAYHRYRGQGVTGLDVAALLFGLVSGVLYFGFGNTALPDHLGTVFYLLLAAQIGWSLVQGEPWTLQYARRSAPPELWSAPAFIAGNRAATVLWGVSFLACAILSVVLHDVSFGIYLPIVILIATALLTQPLARRYGRWFARHS